MIKWNELDARNVDSEFQAKQVINAYVLYCFLTSKSWSNLYNQISDWDGIWIKMWHLKWKTEVKVKNSKLNIADMWLIPLDRVTYSEQKHFLQQADILEAEYLFNRLSFI